MYKFLSASVVAVGLGAFTWAAEACPTVSLPTATAQNSVTFGDAVSYSLPILGINVQSSPGQIADCAVIMTGANGTGINTNFAGADNAYQSPQGTPSDPFALTPWFYSGNPATQPFNTAQNPNPTFTGQTTNTWDITVSALKAFLGAGNDPIIMFNHNQTNSGGAIDQNLFIWAQVALKNSTTGNTLYFYASAVDNGTGLPNFGIPGGDPTAFTGTQSAATNTYPLGSDATGFVKGGFCGIPGAPACGTTGQYMVDAQGQICLDGPVGVGSPVPCGSPSAVTTVNDNLGENNVANAIVFPELDAILNNAALIANYDVLQVDFRLGCNASQLSAVNGPVSDQVPGCPAGSPLNNGAEQIFLTAGTVGTRVPEPSSLAIIGSGFVVLVFWLRRRQQFL